MSGTSSTIASLLTQFPSSGPAGGITPVNAQNLIATLRTRTSYFYVNDAEYGAIGNGSSNPASTRYGSLAALQAFYGTTVGGVTIALTNELDWLAHQKAIDLAGVAGGVIISASSSTYIMSNSNSVADGSGTLLFPAQSYFSPGNAVSWVGENFGGTNINWPVDLGAGRFGVNCASRATLSSVGEFSNLTLTGPGVGSTLNASTCSMQGLATSDRRNISKIYVSGFNYGINIVGGQFLWQDVNVFGCYYGIYFDNPSTVNFGNMQFIRLASGSCKKAAVGINGSAIIPDCHFLTCIFAESPYCIIKETTGGASPTVTMMNDCTFDMCQFEGFGNSAICDDKATTATRVCFIGPNVTFHDCEWSWSSANKIAALPASGIIDIAGCDIGFIFDGIQTVSGFIPGSVAIFCILSTVNGMVVRGNVSGILANCVAAAGGASVNALFSNPFPKVRFVDYSGWEGGLFFNTDTVSVVGSVVTQGTTQQITGTATAGATTDAPMGIMMYNPTPGTASSLCVVADRGIIANVKSTGTIAIGKWVRTAAGGVVTAASSSADVTTPMVGYAMTAATGNLLSVRLK